MFPRARCETCAAYDRCERLGREEITYPACHRPLLDVDLAATRELIDWWRLTSGSASPELDALEPTLLARFERDRRRYSEIFEASLSREGDAVHSYRFSYAFPSFAADRVGAARSILAMGAAFGEPIPTLLRRLLAGAADPAVEQLLFGAAHDGGDRLRAKLYFQMRLRAKDDAAKLASRLLGAPRIAEAMTGKSLHMLGVDLDRRGLVGAKLYVAVDDLRPGDRGALGGPSEMLDAMEEAGLLARGALPGALVIHRLRFPDLSGLDAPSELDFGLAENELRWPELRALAPLQRMFGPTSPLTELSSRFRIGVRRLSVSTGAVTKANVYYVLRGRSSGGDQHAHVDEPGEE